MGKAEVLLCSFLGLLALGFGQEVVTKASTCAYTFEVARSSGEHCAGQQVKEEVAELRGQVKALTEMVEDLEANKGSGSNCDDGNARQVSGAPYIRWGRTECPQGAQSVYKGFVAGSYFSHYGGTSEYICLPSKPEWKNFRAGANGASYVYGAEYIFSSNVDLFLKNNSNDKNIQYHGVPCVMCITKGKRAVSTIPGLTECPTSMKMEYAGYMMSEYYSSRGRTTAICVDEAPEAIQGSSTRKHGAYLTHMETMCGSLPCPNYDNGRELACAVCSI